MTAAQMASLKVEMKASRKAEMMVLLRVGLMGNMRVDQTAEMTDWMKVG